ncbi:MAG: UbiA family prenyltransferase [Phycisphaerales bacterium]
MSSLRAYLELSRISNAPTVVSNVFAGAALGAYVGPAAISAWPVAASAVACVAFYVAGMALNDLFDRTTDARERPTRPIPSGRVSASGAAIFATALIALGLAFLASTNVAALLAGAALVGCILLYDSIHLTHRWSVLVMGACRGMVYVVAALAIGADGRSWTFVGPTTILAVYVASFSVIARREAGRVADVPPFSCASCGYPSSRDHGRCAECGRDFGPSIPGSVRVGDPPHRGLLHASNLFLPLLCAAGLFLPISHFQPLAPSRLPPTTVLATLVLFLFLVGWMITATQAVTRRPPAIGRAVTMWIAAISLYDATLLVVLRELPLALAAAGCFALTRALQRRIAGT